MSENITKVWEISAVRGARRVDLPDTTTLDAITRQIPQGYYSTFRTHDGRKKVLGLHAHLQRLYKPAAMQNINVSVEANALRKYLKDVLDGYNGEVRVRVIMTKEGQVYIVVEALKSFPSEIYTQGVKVITTKVQRKNPRLKSTNFISASEGERAEISQSNIFEALLVRNDFILEGMTSNFFYVRNEMLGTARTKILLGVTRQTVVRVAREIGLDILYRPLERKQAPALSEAFITSSSRGIVPVIQIDDVMVGEGTPGSITKNLMEEYTNYVKQHAEMI